MTECNRNTIEELGRKGYRLIQSKSGFRFGEDTVFLSFFASKNISRTKKNIKVAELGANAGAATILLSARREDLKIDSIEVLDEAYSFLCDNVRLNSLSDKIRPIKGDIRNIKEGCFSELIRGSYDAVFFNPPYRSLESGPITDASRKNPELLNARFEVNGGLSDFFSASSFLLKPGGQMILVCRPNRLTEIFFLCKDYRMEPQRLRMVHPRKDKPASLFLLSAKKHAKHGNFIVEKPLILYSDNGEQDKEVFEIYKEE